LLGLINLPVSALSDTTDDLWECEFSEEDCDKNKGANHPNIDITDVSVTKNGLQLTLSLTVAGTIKNDMFSMYTVYSGTPEKSDYYLLYQNGSAAIGSYKMEGFQTVNITDPLSSDGKTISGTITIVEDVEISPYANTWLIEGLSLNARVWQDWYPNEYFAGGHTNPIEVEEDQEKEPDEEET
jgi:hypothetical protein